jgi:hypothetical protein
MLTANNIVLSVLKIKGVVDCSSVLIKDTNSLEINITGGNNGEIAHAINGAQISGLEIFLTGDTSVVITDYSGITKTIFFNKIE